MFVEIESNPNFEGSYFLRFHEIGPPRPITHVKTYDRLSQGEWCEITGWCDDSEAFLCPAYAQMVEDSGAGVSYLIFGGNWGLRLKPEHCGSDWNLYDTGQWGEGYMVISDARDLRFA